MGINKVMYGSRTVIDISGDTVTPDKLLSGVIGHNASGERITGTHKCEGGTAEGIGTGAYVWAIYDTKEEWDYTTKSLSGSTFPNGYDSTTYVGWTITDDGYFELNKGTTSGDTYYLPEDSVGRKAKKILRKGRYSVINPYTVMTVKDAPDTVKGDNLLGYISADAADAYPLKGVQDNKYYIRIFGSGADATAGKMLSGIVGYTNNGRVTGSIQSQAAQTITPSTTDQTISSGKYLSGTQTIKGDANLLAENIKEGVELFGITGTYTGGDTVNPYKGKTIVAFGDSIIAGWGWKEGTGIVQPLKEKYPDGTWINNAESGANIAISNNPAHTPIISQIRSYTGQPDAIIFDGGVNDLNNNIAMGNISDSYDSNYDTTTICGAMESALQYVMDTFPLAVKLYIIPHSFSKNNYVDSVHEKMIEICKKWNMPYLDMRKCAQIAMTSKNKSKYTRNANTGVGDGVHPVESWYRTFYSPVVDQKLRSLGIGYATASVAPTVIAVTSVSLDKNTLSIKKGESAILTATVKPSNATNQSVKWSTSNSNVTVSNGEVTGKAVGTSVVTVTTDDGGYTAQCTVNVAENTVDPSESHTKLESLSVDGNCYFDTEILPDQNTNTEAKLYIKSGTTYICGARDDKYKYGYTVTDNFYAIRGSVSSAAKNTAFWEDVWTIKQNGATTTFGNNSVTLDNAGNFALTSPFYIGCMSKNGEAAGAGLKGKIYYAKIYSGSELVADMIPVKKADGTLCLYDEIRKKYLYNKGSGAVTELK